MKARLLVAEDDRRIREGLHETLSSEGYDVTAVQDGQQALAAWRQQRFDLILLDIMMPKTSGYDACREIRKTDTATPILMLTAKGEEIDKVVGLKLGADDYLTKPFGIHELLARVEALIRRARRSDQSAATTSEPFRFGELDVDAKALLASRDDQRSPITMRELRLMQVFRRHPGEVMTRQRLLNLCWGVDYCGTTRTLDQHIAQLRKKVEPCPSSPSVITTVHGVGYRYEGG